MRHIAIGVLVFAFGSVIAGSAERPRARDLGLEPGVLEPGPFNAITDVEGVRVGQRTLVEGTTIRTGVTAVVPVDGNLFQSKVPAAVWPANAFGKAAGFLQVQELGNLETPIVLTNTVCVGTAVQAVVDWTLQQSGNEDVRSVNAVVGETNDGFLNDIRTCAVRPLDVVLAIEEATSGTVQEGSVGAGTGTSLFGWKGGIGTASRVLPEERGGYTVGALVQANFSGILTVDGLPVGEAMGRVPFGGADSGSGGSCMIVLATDAPLSARNLERMAKRATLGLARTGSFLDNGSGDFVIAFSTASRVRHDARMAVHDEPSLTNDAMGPLFLATVEAVEEAVLNSLFRATTVAGFEGHTREAFPVEIVQAMMGGGEKTVGQEEHDRRIDYIELPTTDMAATKAFYSDVFGWKMQDWGPDYASFEDGRLAGGFRKEAEVVRGGPLVIVYAVDLEAVADSVRRHGGTIVNEIFSFPGGRRFHFTDPSGNELAVWSDR